MRDRSPILEYRKAGTMQPKTGPARTADRIFVLFVVGIFLILMGLALSGWWIIIE
jgi:hypothetical protein